MSSDSADRVTIAPCSATVLPMIKRGMLLKITDIHGGQVGDLIVFNKTNHKERFSQGQTMVFNGQKFLISKGDALYSTSQNKMMTLIKDTCGHHDILHPPCNRTILRDYLNDGDRSGCEEHLTEALSRAGIDPVLLPYPFNVFQNTIVEGYFARVDLPKSKAGDHIVLRAEMDCIAILSSCAISSYGMKPLLAEVRSE